MSFDSLLYVNVYLRFANTSKSPYLQKDRIIYFLFIQKYIFKLNSNRSKEVENFSSNLTQPRLKDVHMTRLFLKWQYNFIIWSAPGGNWINDEILTQPADIGKFGIIFKGEIEG